MSRATSVWTSNVYFTNAVTEIVAGDRAVIDHYKLQRESQRRFTWRRCRCTSKTRQQLFLALLALRRRPGPQRSHAVLDAEGCECTLNGLYLASGRQHIDNHTVIDHAKPHCTSHELYKGILDGQAHGVFNGKIFVRQDAQKTDAKQTNKTLLLSDDAIINTKPQLEIFADDVKCTHGATVGQLDDEAIFYLRSRGIGREPGPQPADLRLRQRHHQPDQGRADPRPAGGDLAWPPSTCCQGDRMPRRRHEYTRQQEMSCLPFAAAAPLRFDVPRIREDFPISAAEGPRQAAGLPRQRRHHAEAAGRPRRSAAFTRRTTPTSIAASTC